MLYREMKKLASRKESERKNIIIAREKERLLNTVTNIITCIVIIK